jgi:hypothetical protein
MGFFRSVDAIVFRPESSKLTVVILPKTCVMADELPRINTSGHGRNPFRGTLGNFLERSRY